jgi:hypothetical protein
MGGSSGRHFAARYELCKAGTSDRPAFEADARSKDWNRHMDQVKIRVAMAVVAAIILWISGEYAAEAWRDYRALRRVNDPQRPADRTRQPPATIPH